MLIGKNMAGKRGANNLAASAAVTAAATAATAALAAAALAAEAATPALAPDAATPALAPEAATPAIPPSPIKKRPARACNSPNKLAKTAAVHGEVETPAGTTGASAEAPSATPATSYNMRKRLPRPEGSSSTQNDEDDFGDEDASEKDDDLEKEDDLDEEAAVEHTPKKVLPVIANLKRGKGRPPKPSSPQGNSNPYP